MHFQRIPIAVVVLQRTLRGAHTSAVATHVAQTDTHTWHQLPILVAVTIHVAANGALLGR